MPITFGSVSIGAYTFANNPQVEDISNELLQQTVRALDGTMVSSYIPQAGDDTKILRKRTFALSGIDPDVDLIESIEAELEVAGPITLVDAMGNSYSVHVTQPLKQTVSTDKFKVREYSFTVTEA